MSDKSQIEKNRLFSVRVPDSFQRRLKVAAAMEGVTMAEFLISLIDAYDRKRARQRARQASPLHRVAPRADDDDD